MDLPIVTETIKVKKNNYHSLPNIGINSILFFTPVWGVTYTYRETAVNKLTKYY